ncbi:hypothetical protein CPB86DRAFT_394332 [Serendipita vermifera]|nr:hypothetical protein CPB86DRAFT_394332 [Serendipita vermifera]
MKIIDPGKSILSLEGDMALQYIFMMLSEPQKLTSQHSIELLHQNLKSLLPSISKFLSINGSIYGPLGSDEHIKLVRLTLDPFNGYMYLICSEVHKNLETIRLFYARNRAELKELGSPYAKSTQLVKKVLLDVNFQKEKIALVKPIPPQIVKTIATLKNQVISRLPRIEEELGIFAEGYFERYRTYQTQTPTPSRMPSWIQVLIWGPNPNPSVDWRLAQVEALPSTIRVGKGALDRLVVFLEDLQHLVSHLSQATIDDDTPMTLYQRSASQLRCQTLLREMSVMWYTIWRTFDKSAEYHLQNLNPNPA